MSINDVFVYKKKKIEMIDLKKGDIFSIENPNSGNTRLFEATSDGVRQEGRPEKFHEIMAFELVRTNPKSEVVE